MNYMINNYSKRIIEFITYTLVIIYVSAFAFEDSYDYIMKWGLDFVSILKQGQIIHYYQLECADYNIFIIFIIAVWMFPFNLFMKMLGFERNIIIYTIWYKLILVISLYVSLLFIEKILRKLDYTEDDIWLAKIMYIVSPMTLMGNIGWGQIDLIPMMLVIIAMFFCINKRYIPMLILLSIACSFKYHVFILAVPLILLLEKRIIKLIQYFIICISVPVVVETISRIDPYYSIYKNYNSAYMDDILLAYYNHQSIYIACFIILCITCYYIRLDNNSFLVIAVPAFSMFLFMFFVNWHAQWAVYILPFIIIALLSIKNMFLSMILYFIIGMGHFCHQISLWSRSGDNYMINHGIFRLLLNKSGDYNGIPLSDILCPQSWIGQTLVISGLICTIVIFVLEHYHENNIWKVTRDTELSCNVYAVVSMIPSAVFVIFSIIMLYFNI